MKKMANTAPLAGIEPTSLAFWASVLTIKPRRFPYVTTLPAPTCLCGSLPERSVQTITHICVYYAMYKGLKQYRQRTCYRQSFAILFLLTLYV